MTRSGTTLVARYICATTETILGLPYAKSPEPRLTSLIWTGLTVSAVICILPRMNRIKMGLRFAGASWRVVRKEPSLLAFPLFATIFGLLYTLLIVAPLGVVGWLAIGENTILVWVLLAIMLFGSSIGATFFGVAAAANASRVFNGEDPKIGDGIALARSRFGVIVKWALVAATVGLVLNLIGSRGGFGAILVRMVGGAAWGIASFFALPILALEGLGPFATLKRSVGVVRQKWGESLVGVVGIGAVTFLLALAAAAVVAIGIFAGVSGLWIVGIPLIIIGAVALVAVMAVASVLRAVFTVAVFRFATEGVAVEGFDAADLERTFRSKPA